MTQHVDTKQVRERIDRTAEAIAAGHEAFLQEALDSVSWERRGLLGRLSRRPRQERSPGSAA
jgi:hypothetical protein